jgi:hypothetical protein
MVWIDVQGAEADVLAGMTDVLSKTPPLVMEFCNEFLTQERKEEMRLMLRGYPYFMDMGSGRRHALSELSSLRANLTDLLLLPL